MEEKAGKELLPYPRINNLQRETRIAYNRRSSYLERIPFFIGGLDNK